MTTPVVSRAEWNARSPKSISHNITPGRGGVALHWEGPHMGSFPHGECYAKVHQIQAFHMDSRGWVDIAYTGLVCPHGFRFMGRGADVRTAANGTNDSNQNWYAVCFLGGVDDEFTNEAKWAFVDFIEGLKARGAGVGVQPHSHFFSTACPGPKIRDWIASGLPVVGGTPTPAPSPAPQPTDDFRSKIMAKAILKEGLQNNQDVRIMQALLMVAARDLTGNDAAKWIDGNFGPHTAQVLRTWQARTSLTHDGVCGPATWAWLCGV